MVAGSVQGSWPIVLAGSAQEQQAYSLIFFEKKLIILK